MNASLFRHRWGVRLALFLFLVVIWFGLEARRRVLVSPVRAPALSPAASTPSLEQRRTRWREAVAAILKTYEQDKDAAKAREAFLRLAVAREDQEVHLHFVLALHALVEQTPDADLRWRAALAAWQGS